MNYGGKITQGLVDELLEMIHKYDETMMLATALGCLEIVKVQLIQDAQEEDEE